MPLILGKVERSVIGLINFAVHSLSVFLHKRAHILFEYLKDCWFIFRALILFLLLSDHNKAKLMTFSHQQV